MRLTLRFAGMAIAFLGLCTSQGFAQFCGVQVDCNWPVPDVAHWTFDSLDVNGDALDSTINGNTAIWQGPTGNNIITAGLIGSASQANDEDGGSEEHYALPLPELNGATALSVSVWFNQNVASNNNNTQTGLFGNRGVDFDLAGGAQSSFVIFNLDGNNSPRGFDVRVSTIGNVRPGAGDLLPGEVEGGATFDGVLGNNVDEWHNATLTWDGVTGIQSLYFDGTLIAETEEPNQIGSITGVTNLWRIGEDIGNREFTGTLDDTAVWSTALSATDVQQIYDAGLIGVNASQVEPPQPGDVDLDTDVDLIDFGFIQGSFFGTDLERADGDLNGDGNVEWADFREWKDNFPTAASPALSPPAASVPEPGAIGLCLMGLGLGLVRRQRK